MAVAQVWLYAAIELSPASDKATLFLGGSGISEYVLRALRVQPSTAKPPFPSRLEADVVFWTPVVEALRRRR
jgi:hypothetical protein